MNLKQLSLLLLVCFALLSFRWVKQASFSYESVDDLRALYGSGNPEIWPEPVLHPSVNPATFEDIGLLPDLIHPSDNPYSDAKKELGKKLFFDPRLSSSGQIACATCHDPKKGWTDGIEKSIGHQGAIGKRNAMTIVNVGYSHSFFWDGRAETLEEQAAMPIEDPLEMNQLFGMAVKTIAEAEDYKPYFFNAFGSEAVSGNRVRKALSTFQRSIVSKNTKFDEFISGNPYVFSDDEVMGLHLYRTKANCISCHNTPYFSDNLFHNDGQTLPGSIHQDLGAYDHTGNLSDVGKFRTPTLREIAETGPWMHNGNFPTLKDVVDYYNLGNPVVTSKANKQKADPAILEADKKSLILERLHLTKEEVLQLIAFLETLSSREDLLE